MFLLWWEVGLEPLFMTFWSSRISTFCLDFGTSWFFFQARVDRLRPVVKNFDFFKILFLKVALPMGSEAEMCFHSFLFEGIFIFVIFQENFSVFLVFDFGASTLLAEAFKFSSLRSLGNCSKVVFIPSGEFLSMFWRIRFSKFEFFENFSRFFHFGLRVCVVRVLKKFDFFKISSWILFFLG